MTGWFPNNLRWIRWNDVLNDSSNIVGVPQTASYTENGVIYRPWSSFCKLSTYFKACTISKIPTETNYETQFTVKPFWYTMDGSKVYGETTVKSISEYFLASEVYVSATGNDETFSVEIQRTFVFIESRSAHPHGTIYFPLSCGIS